MAATMNWRTINVDAYDPDSPANFDLSTLIPAVPSITAPEIQSIASQVRQLSRGGDSEGALRGALENAPYGGETGAKAIHLSTVTEVLQSIKQAEMTPLLQRLYTSEGGVELLDVLMKYIYSGMSHSASSSTPGSRGMSPQTTGFSQIQSRVGADGSAGGGGQAMSVFLSWHEKVVEVAGVGCILRVMTDRRTV